MNSKTIIIAISAAAVGAAVGYFTCKQSCFPYPPHINNESVPNTDAQSVPVYGVTISDESGSETLIKSPDNVDKALDEFPFAGNKVDASQWAVYRNEASKFEMSVPPKFKIQTRSASQFDPDGISGKSLAGVVDISDPADSYSVFYIAVFNDTFENVYKIRHDKLLTISWPTPVVKQVEHNNTMVRYLFDKESGRIHPGIYFISGRNYTYEVEYTPGDSNNDIFQKMLLSFKSIE